MQSLLRLLRNPLMHQLLEPSKWRLDILLATVYFVYYHQFYPPFQNWCLMSPVNPVYVVCFCVVFVKIKNLMSCGFATTVVNSSLMQPL